MQSPANNIQSPRPQSRPSAQQSQVPYDKELMASLHVLLDQLSVVEQQGLVMFQKIEESFKHPYAQQEAITDTASLLIHLDTLTTQARTTGFGALTLLPTSPTVVSTPSASSSGVMAGTPKPMFLSPRMHNHIHNNLNVSSSTNNNSTAMDVQMMSPIPLSLVSTPAASASALSNSTTAAATTTTTTTTTTGTTGTTPGSNNNIATPAQQPAANPASPFPSSDVIMSSSTPAASGQFDINGILPGSGMVSTPSSVATAAAAAAVASTGSGAFGTPATPATPSAQSSSAHPSAALTQMMEARQRDVQALYSEKRKLKTNFRVAAQMIKP